MKICTNCGVMAPEEATSCPSCGLPFMKSKASQSQPDNDGHKPEAAATSDNQTTTTQPAQPVNINSSPETNVTAIIALILGITGNVFVIVAPFLANFPALIGLIVSIVAVVFGVKARNQTPKGCPGRGMATAGMVCGIIGIILGAIATICAVCFWVTCIACGAVGAANADLEELSECAPSLEDYIDYFIIIFR